MAAGVITWVEDTAGVSAGEDQIKRYVGSWTADGSGNALGTTPAINGTILNVAFKPGSPAPTALYDIVGNNAAGVDICGGLGANLSATVPKQDCPLTTTNSMPFVVSGTVDFAVSNAGSGGAGTIYLWVR